MPSPRESDPQIQGNAAQKRTSETDIERMDSTNTKSHDPAQPRRLTKILRHKRRRPQTEDTSSEDEIPTTSSATSRLTGHPRGPRRKRKQCQPQGCCPVCEEMLRSCFSQVTQQSASKKSNPEVANFPCQFSSEVPLESDRDGFLIPYAAASTLRLQAAAFNPPSNARYRYIKVEFLEVSANECSICALVLSVLHGANGLAITQIKAYSNPLFNRSDRYHDDGITDIDDLLNSGNKTSISLRAVLTTTENSADDLISLFTGLRLEFLIDLRTQTGHKQNRYGLTEVLRIFRQSDATDSCFINSFRLCDDPRPPENKKIEMIRSWTLEKTSCLPIMSHQVRPTRLLDVSHPGRVILVNTPIRPENHSEFPIYAALSHRWGASQHLTATKETMAQLLDGVTIEQLPRTFRDAVAVTLRVGVEYLWIDALCIIQDSTEDWLHESEKMGDIFKNAFVTIAVHGARDDSEGFLERALSKCRAVEVTLDDQQIGICRAPDPDVDITGSGLSRRGWVLQERFLSTRTLHFTTDKIYFETTRGIQCEDGRLIRSQDRYRDHWSAAYGESRSIPRSSLLNPAALPKLRGLLGLEQIPPELEQSSAPAAPHTTLEWLDLVEMYSHCDLTQETDKLIAISGMSRRIHTTTDIAYCAGMWADKICQGLLWLTGCASLSGPFSRAPSWSWAAWDGAVQFPLDVRTEQFVPRCRLVSLQTESYKPTPFLAAPGRLEIRGKLVDVSCLQWHCGFRWYNGSEIFQLELGPGPPRKGIITQGTEDLPSISLKSYVRVGSLWKDQNWLQPVGWIAPDSYHLEQFFDPRSTRNMCSELPLMSTYFLVVGTSKRQQTSAQRLGHMHNSGEQGTSYLGIFLIRKHDEPRLTYKRVGFGQLSRSFLLGGVTNSSAHWEDIFDERGMTDICIA